MQAGGWIPIIEALRNHCPRLKEILLEDGKDCFSIPAREYVELLMGYEDQLTRSTLDALYRESGESKAEILALCDKLLEKCPNVLSDLYANTNFHCLLFKLSPRIQKVEFFSQRNLDEEELNTLANCAFQLRHLQICGLNFDAECFATMMNIFLESGKTS